eukprot:jgi/Galph1/5423/GphlegSOOS_G4055.1
MELGFLLVTPSVVPRQEELTKDLKEQDFEILYHELVSLDREKAKNFLSLYEKNEEPDSGENLQELCTNPCLLLILKRAQASEFLKKLTSTDSSENTQASSFLKFCSKYNTKAHAFFPSVDANSAKELVQFFFPNFDLYTLLENNPRKYLESYVVPTLTGALTQLCKLEPKPAHPCEWLGQYLITHDPTLAPKKKASIFFVLGGPGSGKGTQCDKLVEELHLCHLSAGDLLRREVQSGSSNGQMIDEMIKNGEIVPGYITIELLKRALEEEKQATGFLIDGFPRKLDQAGEFEKIVGDFEFVLFLDCPQDEMARRILKRGEVSGRCDDNEESVRKRFVTFQQTTMPVVEYYKARGKLVQVDASRAIEEVFKDIRKYFHSL